MAGDVSTAASKQGRRSTPGGGFSVGLSDERRWPNEEARDHFRGTGAQARCADIPQVGGVPDTSVATARKVYRRARLAMHLPRCLACLRDRFKQVLDGEWSTATIPRLASRPQRLLHRERDEQPSGHSMALKHRHVRPATGSCYHWRIGPLPRQSLRTSLWRLKRIARFT